MYKIIVQTNKNEEIVVEKCTFSRLLLELKLINYKNEIEKIEIIKEK